MYTYMYIHCVYMYMQKCTHCWISQYIVLSEQLVLLTRTPDCLLISHWLQARQRKLMEQIQHKKEEEEQRKRDLEEKKMQEIEQRKR